MEYTSSHLRAIWSTFEGEIDEMYLHRRCRPDEIDLDYDKVAFGYCAKCDLQGTIYHVKGADDYYKFTKKGVTREYWDGRPMADLIERSPVVEVTEETVEELEAKDKAFVEETVAKYNESAPEHLKLHKKEEVVESIPEEPDIDVAIEVAGLAASGDVVKDIVENEAKEEVEEAEDTGTVLEAPLEDIERSQEEEVTIEELQRERIAKLEADLAKERAK